MKRKNGSKKSSFPVKRVLIFAVAAAIFCLAVAYAYSLVIESGFFRVKYVTSRNGELADLGYLKGISIFKIDLKKEAQRILEYYPDSKTVRLLRSLPDRLFVDFVMRKPLALIKLQKIFIADTEGVLYACAATPADYDLPLITGLESKLSNPRPGTRCDIREFRFALDMIKEANKGRIFKVYQVKRIDVSDPSSVVLFVSMPADAQSAQVPLGLLEVKIGEGGSREKMAMLAGLILASKNDLPGIKYVDLRFKEPVIKLKDQNVK